MIALEIFFRGLFGEDRECTRKLVAPHPFPRIEVPGGWRLLLMLGNHAVGEDQIPAGPGVWTQGGNPDRQPKRGEASGGAAVLGAYENGGRLQISETCLDAEMDEMQRENLPRKVNISEHLLDADASPRGFNGPRNAGQHRDSFDRKGAGGRFAREHHAIRAVKDGIGNIRGLGPGRQTRGRHGLQHLSRSDDGFGAQIGAVHDVLLNEGDPLNGHLHAEIAAGNHDPVRRIQNFIKPLQGAGALNLCDEKGLVTQAARRIPQGMDIGGALNKGLADRIHILRKGEFKTLVIALGECADAEINAGHVQPFARAQLAAHLDHASHFAVFDFRDLQLDVAVIQRKRVAALHHFR
jgi:hypothetical protein